MQESQQADRRWDGEPDITSGSPAPPLTPTSVNAGTAPAFFDTETAIDEAAVVILIKDSHVLDSPHQSWQWSVVSDLVRNNVFYSLAMKRGDSLAAKTVRRLIAFVKPTEKQLSRAEASWEDGLRASRAVHDLVRRLVASEEGTRALVAGGFVDALAAELDGVASGAECVFSQRLQRTTLCTVYFDILRILLSSSSGADLLVRSKMLTRLHNICRTTDQLDFVRQLVEHVSIARPGHGRALFMTLLMGGRPATRLATLRQLHSATLACTRARVHPFVITTLLSLLPDEQTDLAQLAVGILYQLADDATVLRAIFHARPALVHLGVAGTALLYRCLALPAALRVLRENAFLQAELDRWHKDKCVPYVRQVEDALAAALFEHGNKRDSCHDSCRLGTRAAADCDASRTALVPPHLFAELCRSKDGADVLTASGYLEAHLSRVVHWKDDPACGADDVSVLKASIWTVGLVSSTLHGCNLIAANVVDGIARIAQRASVLSLRGFVPPTSSLSSVMRRCQPCFRSFTHLSTLGMQGRLLCIESCVNNASWCGCPPFGWLGLG